MAKSLAMCRVLRLSFSLLSCILIVGAMSIAFLFAFISTSISPFIFDDPGAQFRTNQNLSVTIFAAPTRPFRKNATNDPQYQAVLSWLRLFPPPKVILVGRDPSLHWVSRQFNDSIQVEEAMDFNLKGTPLFHTMLARAQQATTNVSVIVNGDSLLFQNFMDALLKTHHRHPKWVLVGRHWEIAGDVVPTYFSYSREEGIIELKRQQDHMHIGWKEVVHSLKSHRRYGGMSRGEVDYWAWNNAQAEAAPLINTIIPPFSMKRGSYEKWVLRRIINESGREIVEASDAVASISAFSEPSENGELLSLRKSWEAYINFRLANITSDKADLNDVVVPWKLINCEEPSVENVCMIKGTKECRGTQPEAAGGTPDNWKENMEHQKQDISHPWTKNAPGMPHTLDELLPQVADENNVVVMVGVTSNYKEMLLSFICRAQSLGIKHVLVAAFDEALFDYAYTQGLPVYMENSAQDYQSTIRRGGVCTFATECFKQVSKLKSWSVLRVLRKGYSVLWSDIDIVWFENPLPELLALGKDTLPIQSDEPNEKHPENSIRGANSGFYLARAEASTISAFQAIVGHAMGTALTEQPSFYDVLCGVRGERRVGRRVCKLQSGLRVIFLAHTRYPNGHVWGLWRKPDPVESCHQQGCVILHNNFIAGKDKKLKRLIMNRGMWFWDVEQRMCIHPWHFLRRGSLYDFWVYIFPTLNLPIPPPPSPPPPLPSPPH